MPSPNRPPGKLPQGDLSEAARQKAMDAVRNILETGKKVTEVIMLTSGVQLRTREISPHLLRDILKQIPMPKPPVVYLESRGRSEENPSDPVYQQELVIAHEARMEALLRAFYAIGVEVEKVPDDMEKPEDDGWVEELEFAGLNKVEKDNPRMRQLQWLEWYAIKSHLDATQIFLACVVKVALLEQEVMETVGFFLDRAKRRADFADGGDQVTANGDQDQREPPRTRGSRVRRERSSEVHEQDVGAVAGDTEE